MKRYLLSIGDWQFSYYQADEVDTEIKRLIVEDRLLGFQSGQFACRENAGMSGCVHLGSRN